MKNNPKETRGRPEIGKQRTVKVSDEAWEQWRTAADEVGKNLSDWIREVLDREAKKEIKK
jgi:hypothetical protein